MDNYLFLEQPLIDRIESEVKGLKVVAGRTDLASLADVKQIVPAVYVIYLGDKLADDTQHQGNRRTVQQVTQNWAAVLAVNPADGQKDGKHARQQAGVLLAQLIKALTGWRFSDALTPLARAAGTTTANYVGSFCYYPLIFKTSFTFPQAPQWKSTP